jgi:hypothetical protein
MKTWAVILENFGGVADATCYFMLCVRNRAGSRFAGQIEAAVDSPSDMKKVVRPTPWDPCPKEQQWATYT